MEWSVWVKLSFNPSATNHARFYLAAGPNFPADTDSSVFVGIGQFNDLIGLYRHVGSQIVTLMVDSQQVYNQSTNIVRVKVTKKKGWWSLMVNPAGGHGFTPVDSVILAAPPPVALAGIWCNYTSSNATKFYFDEVYCGPIVTDTVPPLLQELQRNDPWQLSLFFNEALHGDVTTNPGGFIVDQGVGPPLLCVQPLAAPRVLHVYYARPFPENVPVTLQLRGIRDVAGNLMPDTLVAFTWHTAQRNGVLINEIMADPLPAQKLPATEYIELYNNTMHEVSLCGWVLWIDQSRLPLPCISMMPGEHLLLVNEKDTSFWDSSMKVVGLAKLTLKNDGACLALQDFKGALVHAVCYLSSWHSTTLQSDGGFSLELKDPSNPCDQTGTWGTTLSLTGGTPGKSNSYNHPIPDQKKPVPLRVAVPDPLTFVVAFNEPIDTTRNLTELFVIKEFPDEAFTVTPQPPLYQQMICNLKTPLVPGKIYQLQQRDTLKDCMGHFSLGATLSFGMPVAPDSGGLVFNEVMYRPGEGGAEYFEIMNNSGKLVDLSWCLLARIDTITQTIKDLYPITDEPVLLLPGDLAVVTRDVNRVLSAHPSAPPAKIHSASKLPSLPDGGGDYALIGEGGLWLDRISYAPSFHDPGLPDNRGVALERLTVSMSGTRSENWYSASAATGHATPGNPNSQQPPNPYAGVQITLEPTWITPHGYDGNRLAFVSFADLPPRSKATIVVTSETGQAVRHLLREGVVATGDRIPWDGTSNNGSLCQGGVYLVTVVVSDGVSGNKRNRFSVILIR